MSNLGFWFSLQLHAASCVSLKNPRGCRLGTIRTRPRAAKRTASVRLTSTTRSIQDARTLIWKLSSCTRKTWRDDDQRTSLANRGFRSSNKVLVVFVIDRFEFIGSMYKRRAFIIRRPKVNLLNRKINVFKIERQYRKLIFSGLMNLSYFKTKAFLKWNMCFQHDDGIYGRLIVIFISMCKFWLWRGYVWRFF